MEPAKIKNVFWSYISLLKNGAEEPGARYVNPIENALTPNGRCARAKAVLEPRSGARGAAWLGPGPGLARGPARPGPGPFIFVY